MMRRKAKGHTVKLVVGMPLETSVWLKGTESAAQLEQWRRDCTSELGCFAAANGVTLTAPTWTEKLPGEDRVPPVPAHISGPAVRLLICEARVDGPAKPVIVKATGFTADLDARDLGRLRAITRRVHRRLQPADGTLSDAECDEIIEQVGIESALKTLRGAEGRGDLH